MFQTLVKIVKIPRRIPAWILAFSLLLFFSCKQDAIFFHVSEEIEPKDPLIEGTPSKVVESSGDLYVANTKHLWKYSAGAWSALGRRGFAVSVAVTSNYIYVRSNKFNLFRSNDNGATWSLVSNLSNVQAIYTANDILFISNLNTIYYLDDSGSDTPMEIKSSISGDGLLLRDAIYDGSDYYLATKGEGIFTFPSLPVIDPPPITGSPGKVFHSLINANGTLYATGGGVWEVPSFSNPVLSGSYKGAALWPNPAAGTPTLLLLGTEEGYRALSIDAGGVITPSNVLYDSMPDGQAGYSMCEDNVVNYLYVLNETSPAPYSAPVIFASTQTGGLLSYRNGSWNYHE
jgi:hypothetical protein